MVTSARKPNSPTCTPRIGVLRFPIALAADKIVPSPPRVKRKSIFKKSLAELMIFTFFPKPFGRLSLIRVVI